MNHTSIQTYTKCIHKIYQTYFGYIPIINQIHIDLHTPHIPFSYTVYHLLIHLTTRLILTSDHLLRLSTRLSLTLSHVLTITCPHIFFSSYRDLRSIINLILTSHSIVTLTQYLYTSKHPTHLTSVIRSTYFL